MVENRWEFKLAETIEHLKLVKQTLRSYIQFQAVLFGNCTINKTRINQFAICGGNLHLRQR